LAAKAARSTLLRTSNIEVVPNPVREEFYREASLVGLPTFLRGLTNLAVLVANDLTDPNKNVKQLVELVKNFNETKNNKLNLILVGRGGRDLHSPSCGVYNLGVMNNTELAEIMRNVKISLMVSSAESFSLSTAEALASGSFPLVRRGTAAAELIQEGITGSTFDSYEELLHNWIQMGDTLSMNQINLPSGIADQFRPVNVAKQYLGLYGELIGK
jgi:glycosyltransferase involved in cell wall biosynthesis